MASRPVSHPISTAMRAIVPAVLLLCSFIQSPAATKRPNFLLIAVDDLNHWVGHLGRNTQAIS